MTGEEKLQSLRVMLEETDDSCRTLDDDLLTTLLEASGGNLRRAAYEGALRKARNDAITLPDGTRLDSNRDYWLAVARSYRTNFTGGMPRADSEEAKR